MRAIPCTECRKPRPRRACLPVRVQALAAAALACGVTMVPAGVAAAPTLGFEDRAIVIGGVTPGGEVALFGVGRGFNGFTGYVLRHDQVGGDDDGDGAVRLEVTFPVPRKSVWAAVDLASGELGLGVPEGFELRQEAFPPGAIGPTRRWLTDQRRYLNAWWIRPGSGAGSGVWGAAFGDGSPSDDDGIENRSIRALLSAFTPIEPGAADPPEQVSPGDVLVVVDPETLEIYAARLAG